MASGEDTEGAKQINILSLPQPRDYHRTVFSCSSPCWRYGYTLTLGKANGLDGKLEGLGERSMVKYKGMGPKDGSLCFILRPMRMYLVQKIHSIIGGQIDPAHECQPDSILSHLRAFLKGPEQRGFGGKDDFCIDSTACFPSLKLTKSVLVCIYILLLISFKSLL